MHSSKLQVVRRNNKISTVRNLIKFHKVFLLLILIAWNTSGKVFADGMENNGPSLVGTWQWLGTLTPVEEIKPPAGEPYTVSFTADGTISMELEANLINGSYEADGKKLEVVPPLVMTLAAWIPDSPAPGFLTLMEHATGYFFKENELFIDTLADGGTLRFKPLN